MEPRGQRKASLFRQVPGLAPMLLAALLARSGATMVGLAIGFVAYQQTKSAFTVAMVAAAFGFAFAASSLIAGHVLERVGLRTMLVGALLAEITGGLALASVTSTAGADVTWLIIFGVTGGLGSALIFVGSQMLIHGLAPEKHLERVVSIDSAFASLGRVAGPALAGILLAQLGIAPVFLIAAVGYAPLACVVAVIAVRVSARQPVRRVRLREAARLTWQLPLLRWAIITAALAETLALPLVAMMPAVTESLNRDAADRLGILVACVAVGSVGQVLVLGRLRERHNAQTVVGVAYVAAGALLLGIGIDSELFVAGFLLVAFGLSVSIGRTLLLTSVHVGSPDSHRHHVLSLYIFVTAVATPIGALIWGAVADRVGIDPTVGGAGIVLMLCIAYGLVSIVRRRAPAPTSVEAAAEAAAAVGPTGPVTA